MGLNILRAAVLRHTNPVIAVDLEEGKEDIAREFGATHFDIPRLVDLAKKEDLKLDKLITKKFKLEQINDVAEAMVKREIKGRWVCEWD